MDQFNKSELLIFPNGSYLMVLLDCLPYHEKINDFIKDCNKKSHITIKYNPLICDIEKYNLDKLGEIVNIQTKNISISENNIIRIDIESLNFNNGVILNKLDAGILHITIHVPKINKPKDSNFFKPINIYEYVHELTGIYCLMNVDYDNPIFELL